MNGFIPISAVTTLLRWATFMRHISGQSSNLDRTRRTLRQEENVARKRNSDDNGLWVGPILMQRVLPVGLALILAVAGNIAPTGRGTAMVMRMMVAVSVALIRRGKVKRCHGLTGGPVKRSRSMMTAMMAKAMISAGVAIRGGLPSSRDSVLGLGMMMMLTRANAPAFFKHFIARSMGDPARRDRGRQAGGVRAMMMITMLGTNADGGLFAAKPPAGESGRLLWAIRVAIA
jgi:hypothetical protein